MTDKLISLNAAIDAMMKLQAEDIEAYGASIPEGFDGDRAVTALKALPSATDTNVGGNLIDRQAALDAIKKLEKPAPTAQHLSAIFDCEDTIKALPSAQPGWIPTSEKLPEEDTPVLICSTEEDKFYHSVAVGWYCGGEWHCWDDRYGKGDVNAWMPLPTPYREGGQS